MTIFIFVGALLSTMLIGVPIALALILAAVAIMLQLDIFDAQIVASNMINGIDNFIFLAVPFFILAGELMNAGGLSRRIVGMAIAMVGHLRGGIGYVAIIASIVMASLSGSAIADSAALAALLVPMLRNAGYSLERAAGLVSAGGIIAPIIPPSIGLIMFGVVGTVSITKLFLAGIVPGLMMGGSLALVWWWLSRKSTEAPVPRMSLNEVKSALTQGIWALLLPVIIVGGMRFGVFTPTEAAVVAVVYAIAVGVFIYRELTLVLLYQCLIDAAKTTSIVMLLVSAAFVSGWLITVANLPEQLGGLLQPFLEHPRLLVLVMIVIVMVVGMALDFTPMVLILTPIMLPVAQQAGVDPVYFGVLFIMAVSIGLITPPVGNVLNVVASVSKAEFTGVARGVLPFLLAEITVLLLLIAFPNLVLVPLSWLM
ncbi:L-dehydroascorbate transporter large permease subunit [Pollutimonas subterranea]|uniref:TRAP transporter large permease protein n=1 Tax=Pollutimonas subterranea TaxID=2045210 RepID=A0A2N4U6U2_9BURK|nr:TRAP transporter large permease subunit [Pollutimonas subterranea]PLC50733.1 L-dehydroascorbate transporter large permease subunit [Pollutimonas subterranea]